MPPLRRLLQQVRRIPVQLRLALLVLLAALASVVTGHLRAGRETVDTPVESSSAPVSAPVAEHPTPSQPVEEAIEAEAVAQALCMTTADFERAFVAFSNKVKPTFQGN